MEVKINSMEWRELRDRFINSLENLGYSNDSLKDYKNVINKLEQFSNENHEASYSRDINTVFIESRKTEISKNTLMMYKTVIRRLEDFIAGCYSFKAKAKQIRFEVPNRFQGYLEGYLEYMRLHGRRESTIKNHNYYCAEALFAFGALGVDRISDIRAQDIYAAFSKSNSKANWSKDCKCFFRYLYKSGAIKEDMSIYIPSVRKSLPLPSTYSREETDRLLESIDRSTELGKRNYAIVLLALRLGIRVGDIVALKLENIDFRAKTISFVQMKTGVPQRLEMLPEIEKALNMYLPCRRAINGCDNLFLSVLPPFGEITRETVNRFVRKFFMAANICIDGKKHGTHSLRMTLASELVSENVPYAVVGKILGHENPNSAGAYVKFDIEMLRACALEVPSPSGLLEEMLGLSDGRCR